MTIRSNGYSSVRLTVRHLTHPTLCLHAVQRLCYCSMLRLIPTRSLQSNQGCVYLLNTYCDYTRTHFLLTHFWVLHTFSIKHINTQRKHF
ncbi:hypothetical protein HanRHA438_Chr14g0631341 [Helianthus annuus]|nr:hypothetical protein HanRHA438_Chr14g0631341 [Helianthus annuus]